MLPRFAARNGRGAWKMNNNKCRQLKPQFTTIHICYTCITISVWNSILALGCGFIHLKMQWQHKPTTKFAPILHIPHSIQTNAQRKFQIHNRTISNKRFYFASISHQWILDDCKIYGIKFIFRFKGESNAQSIFMCMMLLLLFVTHSIWVEMMAIKYWWCVGKYIRNGDNSYASRCEIDEFLQLKRVSRSLLLSIALIPTSYIYLRMAYSFTHLCNLFTRSTKIYEWNVYKVSTKAYGHRFLLQCILRSQRYNLT